MCLCVHEYVYACVVIHAHSHTHAQDTEHDCLSLAHKLANTHSRCPCPCIPFSLSVSSHPYSHNLSNTLFHFPIVPPPPHNLSFFETFFLFCFTFLHTHTLTLRHLRAVTRDLMSQELNYLQSLETLAETYLPSLQKSHVPSFLQGRAQKIFANVSKLYEVHRSAPQYAER